MPSPSKEQLDLITIDTNDKLNAERLDYLFQMVLLNWVSGWDYYTDYNFRFLNPYDAMLIGLDQDCDCVDWKEGDPTFIDLVTKIRHNDSEYFKQHRINEYLAVMELDEVHLTIAKKNRQLLFYKWKYEPETLTAAEKKEVELCGFERREDAELREWIADEKVVLDFPE